MKAVPEPSFMVGGGGGGGVAASAPSGWNIDKRQAIGAAIGLVCIGLLIGFKLASGEPLVIERPVFTKVPCADCAEREVQASRAKTEPQQSVPGDSSIPDD